MSSIHAEELQDERSIVVNVTEEGVIMDVYQGGLLWATVGMTFDEWADAIEDWAV